MSQSARRMHLTPTIADAPAAITATELAQGDLRALWLMLRRRRTLLLAIVSAAVLVASVLALTLPRQYTASAIVMIDPRKTQMTGVDAVVSGLTPDIAAVRTEVAVMRSRAVIDRAIAQLELLDDVAFTRSLTGLGARITGSVPDANDQPAWRSRAAEKVLDNMAIANDGRSFSITVSYSDTDPAQAARIANALADAYLTDQLDAKYQAAQRASVWLGGRLDAMREDVQRAERAVEEYKTAHNLLGVGEETITQQQLVAINAALVQARAERSQTDARLRSTEALLEGKGSLEAASTVLSSPLIQSLKQQEALVRRKEAELAGRYGAKHPTLINTRAELRDIRAKISEEVQKIVQGMRNDVDIAAAKVSSLEGELATAEGRTGIGDQAMVQLRQLQREAAASRSLYEGFLERSKQVAEQQDLQVADARIIARADTPIKPSFPHIPLFIVIGVLLGAAMAFVTALLAEYFDHGFRRTHDLRLVTGVPVLGSVPVQPGPDAPADYVMAKPLSAYAESLRMAYAALRFSATDGAAKVAPKVVMVTSSVPGEGKSTFCQSLGRVLATAGHKVLVIDADVRRPRAPAPAGAPDLLQVMAGTLPASAAVQHDASGMHTIAARHATTARDVLSAPALERVLANLRHSYDVILLDTPPVLAVADTAAVASVADGVVYVVRWAETPRELVVQGINQLHTQNASVLGTVLTQVDMAAQAKYEHAGGYYARYQEYYAN